MPFFLLLLLSLLSLQGQWPAPPSWLGWWGSLAAPLAGLLLFWMTAAWLGQRQTARLVRFPDQRPALLRRFQRQRGRHFLALAVFYLAALFFLGWGWAVKHAWSDWPGPELLLLAPFVAGLALLWSRYYDVDRTTHELGADPDKPAFPSRAAYVALQARHNLMLVVPPLSLVLLQETLFFLFPQVRQNSLAEIGLALGLLAFALLSMPFLLKQFLGLVSLPEGPVRQRLFGAALRLNLRIRDILLWPTRGTVANAMVTGIFGWNRYIVVTDRLLQELTEDEIEAVFGHEVGHVKHHHLFCYIVFILASLIALGGLGQAVKGLFQLPMVQSWFDYALPVDAEVAETLDLFAAIPLVGLVGLYLFIVFGYLSRRCERQADIYGARATSPEDFISALDKVAVVNGISRDKPGWLSSWLHGTIGQRIDFLRRMMVEPHLEPQFQQRVGLLQWGLPGSLVLLAVVLGFLNARLSADGVWDMLKWI